MYILQFLNNPIEIVILLLAILIAVSIHEYAHAVSAVYFGDDTPRLMGRTTLNPLAHIDPLGAILFILIGFGWGKPVVINPARLPRRIQELWIALAGPFSNLILALIINIFLIVFSNLPDQIIFAFKTLTYINIGLAAFNILPIPPLDGSSILAYLFPSYRSFVASQLGLLILFLLILSPIGGGSLLSTIITPIINLFSLITLTGI